MKRIVIGAIVGALIVFFTSAIVHMFTPLGTAGAKMIPHEDAVIDAMRNNLTESGVYFYPGMNMQTHPSEAEQKAWEEKLRRGPSGMIIHVAQGSELPFPKNLIWEFLTVLGSCLVAAWVVSRTVGTYGTRVIIVAMFAVFAFLSITASHWIWYQFPTPFVMAEFIGELIAYLLGGLAIAKIVPPPLPQ
ncbi:MAG TPA: hypothetical protein VJZ00_08300 [Thermoanaerobaculia bacterium]|nr:hypothetical protein [Thermoanaerobaculia bacterium]